MPLTYSMTLLLESQKRNFILFLIFIFISIYLLFWELELEFSMILQVTITNYHTIMCYNGKQ